VGTGVDEPVVGLLAEEWDAIAAFGRRLGGDDWDRPSACPGWSVRDLLSHMIGTERSLLGDPPPDPPATVAPYVRNEVGERNEAWVASRRATPGERLVEEFAEVTARRLDMLLSCPSARFDEVGPSPVGHVPYREFMRVRVMDCWVHEQDMRLATNRPGHRDGPVADLAIDRIASAMAFVVGKRAAAPEGASVRFELSPRRLDIAVRGGRAVVVDRLEGAPTASLAMDVQTFWRLGCGRLSGAAARRAGLVELGNDAELGARVLDAMAIMI